MTTTTQLNLRIPVKLKKKAQNKAQNFWTNLNFLVKLFLIKFIQDDDLIEIKQNIKMEKIFDKWILRISKISPKQRNNHTNQQTFGTNNRWRRQVLNIISLFLYL